MKKLILLAAFMVIAFQGFSQTSLEPTKLGEWNRPAATGIADVDQYIDACADMYQEAMDIRKQYEAIDTLTLNVGEALEIAQNNDETINHKIAEYKALFERVEAPTGCRDSACFGRESSEKCALGLESDSNYQSDCLDKKCHQTRS